MHHMVEKLRGGLIVSCQAGSGDGLYGPKAMADMALAAQIGGAVGLRANGVEDIAAIRQATSLPIIGIDKQDLPGLGIRITPSLAAARAVVEAGATIVAVDATRRGAEEGRLPAAELIRQIRETLGVPVMADIATYEEGIAAAEAGADIVATTLSGYTAYSPPQIEPDFELLARLAAALSVPVIAEGRIASPEHARRVLELGGFAVVSGSMITKPRWITEQYAGALRAFHRSRSADVIGVDIGGTKIATGLLSETDPTQVLNSERISTQGEEGGEAVLRRVGDAVERALKQSPTAAAIGVSTGGVVDRQGRIHFATDLLPGWAGQDIKGYLSQRFGLPVGVENDGQAATLAEAILGAGRGYASVLGVTVGTGIGGGFVIDGQVYHADVRGGLELGHIGVVRDGRPCPCGRRGCLEAYASGGCLVVEYNARAAAPVETGEAVMAAAQGRDPAAVAAIRAVGEWLGFGLASAVNLLNPSVVVIGGGVARIGELFMDSVRASLREQVYPPLVDIPVLPAALKNHEGVIGAGLVARSALRVTGN
ncbi:MAG: putative N-acetylmannosamine-6-phosphate 2-epimerase [Chloroflexi bacterium]|nr:putative N-acetylmannosamine-6-phosphate 2-epimerase [Chloroflexota bacterium]